MATIKDVAKLAGVSNGTVSKVVNNYELVSEETKQKVLKAIEELNYIPNQVASSLSSKHKNKIGLIIKVNEMNQSIDELVMQYILGATTYARKNQIDIVTIFSTELEQKTAAEITMYLRSLSITGLVMYAISRDDQNLHDLITTKSFPTIVVDGNFNNEMTGSIMIDHKMAQYDVANAMYELNDNVNSILYIAGKKNGFITELRTQGITEFAKEKQIDLKIIGGDFSEHKAYQLAIKHAKDYDAIVCASDLMAIGVLRALREIDIFRPITGFDGIKLMAYVAPDIITVKQDFFLISEFALEELNHLLKNDNAPRLRHVDYAIQLIKHQDVVS